MMTRDEVVDGFRKELSIEKDFLDISGDTYEYNMNLGNQVTASFKVDKGDTEHGIYTCSHNGNLCSAGVISYLGLLTALKEIQKYANKSNN